MYLMFGKFVFNAKVPILNGCKIFHPLPYLDKNWIWCFWPQDLAQVRSCLKSDQYFHNHLPLNYNNCYISHFYHSSTLISSPIKLIFTQNVFDLKISLKLDIGKNPTIITRIICPWTFKICYISPGFSMTHIFVRFSTLYFKMTLKN